MTDINIEDMYKTNKTKEELRKEIRDSHIKMEKIMGAMPFRLFLLNRWLWHSIFYRKWFKPLIWSMVIILAIGLFTSNTRVYALIYLISIIILYPFFILVDRIIRGKFLEVGGWDAIDKKDGVIK